MVRVPFLPQVGRQGPQSTGFGIGGSPQFQFNGGPVQAKGENATSQLAGRVQSNIDRGAVLSADTILSEKAAKVQMAYRSKLGIEGANDAARDAAIKEFEDQRAKLEAAMGNNEQRDAFRLQADRTAAEHRLAIDKHYGEQSLVYEAQASVARSEGAIDSYAENYINGLQEAATGNLETIDAEVRTQARLRGDAPEAVGAMVRDAKSKAHGRVLERLAAEKPELAAEYYKAHRNDIDPGQRGKIESAIQKASVADEAIRFARSTMTNLAGEVSLAEQKARAMEMINGQFDAGKMSADQYRARVDATRSLYAQAQDDYSGQAVAVREAATQWFTTPGNETKTITDLERENPMLAARMDEFKVRDAVTNFVENGQRDTTDHDTWLQLQDVSDESLASVSAVQLNEQFGGKLSKRDLEGLLARRARAGGKASKEQMRMLSQKDWTDRIWDEMWTLKNGAPLSANASPQQKADYQKQKEDWLVRFEDGRLKNWQAKNGPADTAALRKLLGEEKSDVVMVSGGWGAVSQVPVGMLDEKGLSEAETPTGPMWEMPDSFSYRGSSATRGDIESSMAIANAERARRGEPQIPITAASVHATWTKLGKPGRITVKPAAPVPAQSLDTSTKLKRSGL